MSKDTLFAENPGLEPLPRAGNWSPEEEAAIREWLKSPAGEPLKMTVGDINSDAKGSGARANGGKPDLSLLPLVLMANHLGVVYASTSRSTPVAALESLGIWQRTRDAHYLYDVLTRLSPDGWEECARVFEYGRKKYSAWNWAKGMPWSVPLACAARHLLAMISGELLDKESGLPHRGHVYCNVVMLLQYGRTYQEGDDLPKEGLL